ncbi:MAG: EAL domain-containing protein [Phormidesmis sp.]
MLDTLLSRIGCLLHCPTDTLRLWPQVLAVLGDELACSATQLVLPPSAQAITGAAYGWGTICPLPADTMARLQKHFNLNTQSEMQLLWQQATDLQAQLAALVADGCFHLGGTQLYNGNRWPAQLTEIFGEGRGRHLALLPLRKEGHEPNEHDAMGLLALLRSPHHPPWSEADVRLIEAAGSQIYLALRRSLLDQATRTRSACDQLTQLPDRFLFNQQMVHALARAAQKDTMLGVAFLDLDRFKNINDTLGHEAGDCLLQQVASRLKGCLRGYDVVARWGGDEFTLLLDCLRSPEDISSISERILQRLSAPFQVQGAELYVTASLGIALAPYDGEDAQTLLRNADAAMYQAKSKGRNNYQVYFEEINANARTQLNLETDLRKAIDNGELFLCYQPQVDLISGQWIGLEALVRWQHPTLGIIPPVRFIPIAEETGLIEPIGNWVLKTACAQYRRWHCMGFPKLRLAVNLSPRQFHRSHLVRSVVQILNATGFDPRDLELEVTESAAMQDVNAAIEVLKKLSLAGIQIAMDDFGTGYSSLSVLKHFPLDTIKIDRSFVMDLVNSPSDAAIAATIIALAKGLNFKVLAEGIETPEQIDVLTGMGCDYAQGYWFSRPLNVGQIDDLLSEGKFFEVANPFGEGF